MKKIILPFLIFTTFCCNKESNNLVIPTQYSTNPKVSTLDKNVDSIFVKYQKEIHSVGLSIGIYKNGVTTYYGYGETKLNSGKAPDENTYYEIGSITKTFTAIASMNMLIENSETIENPVRPYLPAKIPVLAREGIEINFKHLMTHTSGLPRQPDNFQYYIPSWKAYAKYNKLDLYNWLTNVRLLSKPFTKLEYSNVGFGLLGHVLELNYSKNYEEVLTKKVFEPLQLNDTKVEMSKTNLQKWATGYEEGKETPYWETLNALNGAGVIKSTASDMVKYGIANLNPPNTVLGKAIKATHDLTFEKRRCLGWFLITFPSIPNESFLWHNGATDGFNSEQFINKNKNIVLVILFNNSISQEKYIDRQKFVSSLVTIVSK